MTDQAAPALAPETKSFRGSWLLYRKKGGGLRRHTGGGTPPRFRHDTFDSAEAEAKRLLGLHPDSTFLILREMGRVKLKPVEIRPFVPFVPVEPDDMPDAVSWATNALDHLGPAGGTA
jgi:hypothetical protein